MGSTLVLNHGFGCGLNLNVGYYKLHSKPRTINLLNVTLLLHLKTFGNGCSQLESQSLLSYCLLICHNF